MSQKNDKKAKVIYPDVSGENFQNAGTYFQPEVLYDEEYGTYADTSKTKNDECHCGCDGKNKPENSKNQSKKAN